MKKAKGSWARVGMTTVLLSLSLGLAYGSALYPPPSDKYCASGEAETNAESTRTEDLNEVVRTTNYLEWRDIHPEFGPVYDRFFPRQLLGMKRTPMGPTRR